MRDILFRGKRIDNGEWIKGYYISIGEKSYIICEAETSCIDGENTDLYATEWYEVAPKTVCLCTGKEYMDSEIAYEGDIFESQVSGDLMILRFGTYRAYCPVDKCYMDSVGFYAESKVYPDMPIGDLCEYALKKGNIFDNPELLKGAQDD